MLPCPGNTVGDASAIRQCFQDIEALFSDFNIGGVGVGVIWGRRGNWFGGGEGVVSV